MQTVSLLNERFKENFNSYKNRIEKISNPKQQELMLALLNDIVIQVNSIDRAHENLMLGNKNALSSISDNRNDLVSLRKQLEQRLTALKV